jgi:chemotaxis protein CheD
MRFITPIKKGDSPSNIISHFINPGEFYFSESNAQIHTILGSCIAITLWHPILKIGGMCHFVLPGRRSPGRVIRIGSKPNGRYLDAAMELFEREAVKRGTQLNEYQAKIFGGGNMLTNTSLQENKLIGEKNTAAALKRLTERGILLLALHVGKTGHRRIAFDVSNGDVWVKHAPLQKHPCCVF